ncbi:MAG TPA: glycosyl hydrolase 115 family protein, partial [Bryobacteraceae bacterium]|nr:glycosyl hydrolase 115 family protein [Bryobacteraceae bacterium]
MLTFKRLAALVFLVCAAQAQTAITNRITVLVGPHELHPVVRAAEDLVSDLTKVLGPGPRLVRDVAETAPVTLWVTGLENNLAGIERPEAPESFVIATARRPRGGTAIVLAGADMRGTVYAIYQFSQQYLGVDPLYFWTDHEPARRHHIVLPSHLRKLQGPPMFRNRGWFINDEDLLTGWKPGATDGTGIALSVWDKLFEALLRLKGNMIVPGTFIFPDEPQVRAATERGLIIAQHHIEVLGTNTYRWPDDKPYSFVRFPKLLEAAWEKAVETYVPNQEVLWTVGYRGRHDRPFWEDDRFAGASDRDKGRVIDEAMDAEMKIVRRHRSHPEFIMNAWDEAVGLLKEGDLQVPPGVSLVWPDDGHGTIRDEAAMAKKQGVYYHTAMHDFMANQLTEMVPPARIEEELGRAVRAGATEYLLDNTSDLRPVPM